jgi:hypothetical protein
MVFPINLSGNVPLFGQQSCCWCGAASAQMIMDGYPNAADRKLYPQGPPTVPPGLTNCWDVIQAHNSTDPTDASLHWCTDPKGLRDCLMTLNPPPNNHNWVVFAYANRDTTMFEVLYWMNQNNYPVAALINGGGHWVVIIGYITDIQPLLNTSPTLQQITFLDPEPHNVGTTTTMTAAQWYATPYANPVGFAGTWHNQYVAVVEPPSIKSTIKVIEIKRTGKEIISPKEAIANAKKAIDALELEKDSPHAIIKMKGIRNLQPLLVREEIKSGLEKETVPYYYIVPYGFEGETGHCGVHLARLCVIINAHTGKFEEITTFGAPIRYLPQDEAIDIVAKAFHFKTEETTKMLAEKAITATLMFQPSEITHIRTYPFWKIATKEQSVYVDQLGKLYGTIEPAHPGD